MVVKKEEKFRSDYVKKRVAKLEAEKKQKKPETGFRENVAELLVDSLSWELYELTCYVKPGEFSADRLEKALDLVKRGAEVYIYNDKRELNHSALVNAIRIGNPLLIEILSRSKGWEVQTTMAAARYVDTTKSSFCADILETCCLLEPLQGLWHAPDVVPVRSPVEYLDHVYGDSPLKDPIKKALENQSPRSFEKLAQEIEDIKRFDASAKNILAATTWYTRLFSEKFTMMQHLNKDMLQTNDILEKKLILTKLMLLALVPRQDKEELKRVKCLTAPLTPKSPKGSVSAKLASDTHSGNAVTVIAYSNRGLFNVPQQSNLSEYTQPMVKHALEAAYCSRFA